MSFEWQDREVAARTLGVDVATLQAWIDAGQAPSRHHSGKLQVLIELLDEGETTAETNAPPAGDNGSAAGAPQHTSANNSTKQSAGENSADESVAAESAEPRRFQTAGATATGSELELISKRELQLAGGMVAAWQRVAETAGQDLTRARRLGAVSWGVVAVMLVAGGIGLWATTRNITDVQGRLEFTKSKLDETTRDVEKSQESLAGLQELLRRRTDDLADANTKLATAIERSDLTKAQADKLAAQHLLTKQIADRQAETAKALTDTLSATIEEQKAKLATLEKELAATRLAAQAESAEARKREIDAGKREAELAGKLAGAEKQAEAMTRQNTETTTQRDNLQKQTETLARQITEMTAQRDALQNQVEKLNTANADATKKIDELQKQLQAMKEQAGKSKSAVAEGTK